MASQLATGGPAVGEGPREAEQGVRYSPYWLISRTLMVLWLLLSLWQIGVYPLAESDIEPANVLAGFRAAMFTYDPVYALALFVQPELPLSYLPSVAGAHLLPVSEFTMRLPYALIGALQLPLLFGIVGRTLGHRAALLAGVLLLGSGLFALIRTATGMPVFTTFSLAGAYLLVRYMEQHDRKWLVAAITTFALSALVSVAGIFVLAVSTAIVLWHDRNDRKRWLVVAAGPGALAALLTISVIIGAVAFSSDDLPFEVARHGLLTQWKGEVDLSPVSPAGFASTWLLYLGAPVAALLMLGLAEAVIRRDGERRWLIILSLLAVAQAMPWLVMERGGESAVSSAAPFLVGVAGFGLAQLLVQLNSVATKTAVAMTVAVVALAGIAWNQSVFNPDSVPGLTAGSPGERVALPGSATESGASGLFESDLYGIRALAHVLREETEPGDTIFAREGLSAAAVSLYSARNARPLELEQFTRDPASLDGAFLVLEGEDEAFNAGLSGTISVVANHRVFQDGKVLYQVIKFSVDGPAFSAPIWWRAEVAGDRLFRDNTRFSEFIPTPRGA